MNLNLTEAMNDRVMEKSGDTQMEVPNVSKTMEDLLLKFPNFDGK